MRGIILHAVVLILWTGVIFAAVSNIIQSGADPFALLFVVSLGLAGILGVGRGLLRRIRDRASR